MNIGECFGEWQSVIGIPSRLTVHGSPPTSHETLESPDGDYLLPGLPRSALPALACKSCACRPWQARSPGQESTGLLAHLRLTHPRTTGSFLCVPKERNRKKGHPGLCARKPRGSPRSGLGSDGSPKARVPVPGANAGVLAPPLRACPSLSLLPRLE